MCKEIIKWSKQELKSGRGVICEITMENYNTEKDIILSGKS